MQTKLTMKVQDTWNPASIALFVNQKVSNFVHHRSWTAFTTRDNEVVLRDCHRIRILHRSSYLILNLLLTDKYIFVLEQSVHQLLVYSLKSERIKKKIAAHRKQPLKAVHCRQSQFIVTMSEDQCLIFNQHTLSKIKTLQCTTSNFVDIAFCCSGQYFFTTFKDNTAIKWNCQFFPQEQFYTDNRTKLICGGQLIIFNQHQIAFADYNKKKITFQQISNFWKGVIKKVQFFNQYYAVLTNKALYIINKSQLLYKKQEVNAIISVQYQNKLLILQNNFQTFTLLTLEQKPSLKRTTLKNPLNNEGQTCAGGYLFKQGCKLMQILPGSTYQVNHQLEQLYQNNLEYSQQNLKIFLKKYKSLPDKHRSAAYTSLLNLPINPEQFRKFQKKGIHFTVQLLQTKYPLINKQLKLKMKSIMSVLSHAHPLFSIAQNIPKIVFPFVCLFGKNQLLCTDIIFRLFTNHFSFLFEEYPLPNSFFLLQVKDILQKQDLQLSRYLDIKNIFTKLSWSLINFLFTTFLNREYFLAFIDHVIVFGNSFSLFFLVSILIYCKDKIISQNNINIFIETEQTIHIQKIIKKAYFFYQKYQSSCFKKNDLSIHQYEQNNLKHFNKNTLTTLQTYKILQKEQLYKKKEQKVYQELLLENMQQIIEKIRIKKIQEHIKIEGMQLKQNKKLEQQCPFEENFRIQRIEKLMDEANSLLKHQQSSKKQKNNVIIPIQQLKNKNQQQINAIQKKVIELINKYKMKQYLFPIDNLFNYQNKTLKNQNKIKAAVTSNIIKQLWDINQIQQQNIKAKQQKAFYKQM